MRKIMHLAIALGAVAVLAAGCSSDSNKTSTGSTGSSSSGGAAPVSLSGKVNDKGTGEATSGKLDVELNDFYIEPTYIKVTAGSTVTLTLKNEGKAQHTFTSTALNVDQVVDPGKSVDVTITVPSSLPVEVHCRFHQAGGMQGALFAVAGGSATSGATGATTSNAGYYN